MSRKLLGSGFFVSAPFIESTCEAFAPAIFSFAGGCAAACASALFCAAGGCALILAALFSSLSMPFWKRGSCSAFLFVILMAGPGSLMGAARGTRMRVGPAVGDGRRGGRAEARRGVRGAAEDMRLYP